MTTHDSRPAAVKPALSDVPTDAILTTAELSAWLKTPAETLRYWRWKGTGPRSYRLGSAVRYDRADVLAWLAEQKHATGSGGGQKAGAA